ncbi:MAG TPA: nucleotidyltransferase domain-containing protein [Candidatus Nanoarchaeia archaeon]|nr:nucleotidyltransferase domain-containing protein [Candidatus Nanoarchaeia archaeon]
MDKEKNKIINLLKKFKIRANEQSKLNTMILFGSRATGKAKKYSDIDLLLISPAFKKKKQFQRSPPFYLLWDYPYDVDILCLTPEEMERKKKEIGIIQQAVKEGIVI